MTTRAKEGDASGTALGKEDGGRPEQLGIAPIVGGDEQGSSIQKPIDQPRGSFVRLLIQSGERLIEQHGVAGRQQGAQQLDAAPLAAGEPSNRGSGVDLGSQLPQQRCDGAGARARTREERDILHRGCILDQPRVLKERGAPARSAHATIGTRG